MNFKTLLLGSAAAMIVAGGAQAADLTVAEPVDYVKVCDAFGAGFFYSPGTDTCIKVGGYVKFGTAVGDSDLGTYNAIYPDSNWNNFFTEVSIQLTASSVTEFGNLTGWIDLRTQTGNTGNFSESLTQAVNAATNSTYIDTAYLELGPLKAGRFTSLFDLGRGYTDTGGFGSDSITDHVQLTYAINGFGLAVSIEDQRDRGAAANTGGIVDDQILYVDEWGYVRAFDEYYEGGQDNVPDVVGAVTYASGIFSAKLSAAYTNQAIEFAGGEGTEANPYRYDGKSGYAVGGSVEFALDSFSPGDKFFITAAYGDNANSYTGITGGTSVANLTGNFDDVIAASAATGSSWSALASYKHVWSPTVWTAVTGGYAEFDGDNNDSFGDDLNVKAWRVIGTAWWNPVKNLDVVLDGGYSSVNLDNAYEDEDDQGAWFAQLWLKRSW